MQTKCTNIRLFILFILCLSFQPLYSQSHSALDLLQVYNEKFHPASISVPLIRQHPTSFTTLSVEAWYKGEEKPQFAYILDNEGVKSFHTDAHVNDRAGVWISALVFIGNSQSKQIEIVLPQNMGKVTKLIVHQFAPSGKKTAQPIAAEKRIDCECPMPPAIDRDQWCDGGCPKNYTPSPNEVTHLIIHHSAGPNESNNWSGVVESYWDYHVNTRGWDDIGYNWLIDPEGKVYIGRGENVKGAHFCGKNTGSEGICMIGTYETVEPTKKAKEGLISLLAYRACALEIEPKESSVYAGSGIVLDNITGHRSDCSTECPGDKLWNLLPEIRTTTHAFIDGGCEVIQPDEMITLEGNFKLKTNEISLNWVPTYTAINPYSLRRKHEDETWKVILETDKLSQSYVNLLGGQEVQYQVVNDLGGKLIFSNIFTVKVPDYEATYISPAVSQSMVSVHIENNKNQIMSYLMYDNSGRLVKEEEFIKNTSRFILDIDITTLSAGQYYLFVTSEDEKHSYKFIKI